MYAMSVLRTVPETGSTNDDLASLAREGAPEGLWLRAERQTGGRGRQGREWHSPPGNLYASTLVRLAPGDPPAPTLALVAAVALHEVASAFAGEAGIEIKWPNDLLVAGAKLSGILLERLDDAVVVGFGVNLLDHPDETTRPATSFAMLLAVDAGNTNLVFALLEDGRDPRALADRDRSAADGGPICGLASPAARARGLAARRRRRGDHRHGGAARAPQSRSARPEIFQGRAADRGAGRGRGGSSSTSPSRGASAPTGCSTRSPRTPSTKAT
jgi:hypothetical protein